MPDQVKILAPSGCLGWGASMAPFEDCLERHPDVDAIAVDAGSLDLGPYYLGTGTPFTGREATKAELRSMVLACKRHQVPGVIGTAGSAGGRPHVETTVELVDEIVREEGITLRVATIDAELDRGYLARKVRSGQVRDFEKGTALTEADVERSTRIVGQMGCEPIMAALDHAVELVIAGRACDDHVLGSFAIWKGVDKGIALHAGKVLECGALAARPEGVDGLLATIDDEGFTVEPADLGKRCTPASVAAHQLYERTNPHLQPGPGGVLEMSDARFEQAGERAVRVTGSRYTADDEYWVKIEGAALIGYRTVFVAGIRDPRQIAKLDEIEATVREHVDALYGQRADHQLYIRRYGVDAVLGPLEQRNGRSPHEVGLVIEAIAPTQAAANGLCRIASGTWNHLHFDGSINGAYNLAIPFSPWDLDCGPVYDLSAFHLVHVDEPLELFPVTVTELGRALTVR